MKKFLIMGHPRSGTLYASYIFNAFGLHVGHEKDEEQVFRSHGIVTKFDGYSSGVFKNMKYPPDVDVTIHMVRYPLHVISSCRKMKGRLGWRTIKTFRPDLLEGLPRDLTYRMMLSWLVFTEEADKVSVYRFRIEDVGTEFTHICNTYLDLPINRFPKMVPRVNVSKPPQLSWEELYKTDAVLASQIEAKGIEYGYEDKIIADKEKENARRNNGA